MNEYEDKTINKVRTKFGEYGFGVSIHTDAKTKLSYLVTMLVEIYRNSCFVGFGKRTVNKIRKEENMGKEYTELAIIEPLDMDFRKEKVLSKVSVVTGEHAHRKFNMMVSVNVFRYHFWGSTFEVIKYNERFELLDVRDIVKDDLPKFNLGVAQALTYNQTTHEVVATNGFVYNIDDSLYGKYCPHICQRIYGEIATAENFTLMLITMNGAVIDLTFDKNVNPEDYPHRNILTSGFVTTNTKALRFTMPSSKAAATDRNEKLSQDDIDDLIEKMLGDRR